MAVIRFNPAAARRGDKLALRWGTAELQLEHDVVMPTARWQIAYIHGGATEGVQ